MMTITTIERSTIFINIIMLNIISILCAYMNSWQPIEILQIWIMPKATKIVWSKYTYHFEKGYNYFTYYTKFSIICLTMKPIEKLYLILKPTYVQTFELYITSIIHSLSLVINNSRFIFKTYYIYSRLHVHDDLMFFFFWCT